jgi:hypothetical protein
MNYLSFILIIMGISFMVVTYVKENMHCPPPKVEYKFKRPLPIEEQLQPIPLDEMFGDMFGNNNVYMGRKIGTQEFENETKRENINEYNISLI